MRRLYLHIYAALLFSLVVFAILAGLIWRYVLDEVEPGDRVGISTALAEMALPPLGTPETELKSTLERLQQRLKGDIAVFTPQGAPIASVGDALPPPSLPQRNDRTQSITLHGFVYSMVLPDGRIFVVRRPAEYEEPIPRFFLLLAATVVAVGAGSYPVARRLARRIEALKDVVDGFGAGDLSRRIAVSGKDEVAALADSFNRTAARIESLLFAHKTLLANASHELRSPLARLRMGIEMLQDHADPKLRKELERNIAELDVLIDEILLASRLDALDEMADAYEVDLLALTVEECAAADASFEGVPVTVQGNSRLLRRLVRNLLDNARRHGGGTAVEVSLHREPEDKVTLSVCDHGLGVATEERERIFEPFYRPAGTREREGGVGLGLALVRQIARRHGGEVRCLPRLGGGTCFEVRLSAQHAGSGDLSSGKLGSNASPEAGEFQWTRT